MDTTHVTYHDMELLVDWFTYRLDIDDRKELMADLPLVYGRLFPGVQADIILAAVDRALARNKAKS